MELLNVKCICYPNHASTTLIALVIVVAGNVSYDSLVRREHHNDIYGEVEAFQNRSPALIVADISFFFLGCGSLPDRMAYRLKQQRQRNLRRWPPLFNLDHFVAGGPRRTPDMLEPSSLPCLDARDWSRRKWSHRPRYVIRCRSPHHWEAPPHRHCSHHHHRSLECLPTGDTGASTLVTVKPTAAEESMHQIYISLARPQHSIPSIITGSRSLAAHLLLLPCSHLTPSIAEESGAVGSSSEDGLWKDEERPLKKTVISHCNLSPIHRSLASSFRESLITVHRGAYLIRYA
ncbi:hypothetical protein BHE74_00056773 [Ensete ventricosum]|nr:hypothetical protein BHE74_00056773 [Ensete ventricosum]